MHDSLSGLSYLKTIPEEGASRQDEPASKSIRTAVVPAQAAGRAFFFLQELFPAKKTTSFSLSVRKRDDRPSFPCILHPASRIPRSAPASKPAASFPSRENNPDRRFPALPRRNQRAPPWQTASNARKPAHLAQLPTFTIFVSTKIGGGSAKQFQASLDCLALAFHYLCWHEDRRRLGQAIPSKLGLLGARLSLSL